MCNPTSRWTQVLGLVALAATEVGCSGERIRAGGSNPPPPNLTKFDHCMINALRERDTPEDDCLADCFERGTGRDIGGGCYHVCFAYREDRSIGNWKEPEAWLACEVLRDVPAPTN